ncbi:S-adenosyl-L-methionine-dependentmethyltransferases superfamily protein [Striga asiatica]|uniref:S-adenosyl-L-methionine-dependentmethyltransferases superfamily protein n=1 Tax=Striga asiatica TaxID=4170 RepID=A0A5A7Q0E7_STRAF|nr:S-adenosyl-L-methionine-dependentmethyltransferases superfamily protein [Striga asiatica]
MLSSSIAFAVIEVRYFFLLCEDSKPMPSPRQTHRQLLGQEKDVRLTSLIKGLLVWHGSSLSTYGASPFISRRLKAAFLPNVSGSTHFVTLENYLDAASRFFLRDALGWHEEVNAFRLEANVQSHH